MANAKQEDVDMAPAGDADMPRAHRSAGAPGVPGEADEQPLPEEAELPELTAEEQEWLRAGGVPEEATPDQRKRWQEVCASLAEQAAKRQRRG
eukprot:4489904-Pyramimonas_sp.AAC.2